MRKGVFIVLDGNDGSGKATQSRLLAEMLSADGVESMTISFPRYSESFFGALLAECLAGKEGDFLHTSPKISSPLYALDRLEASPDIQKALEEGKVVIADRFASSNQIHQGGKIADEKERETFLKWLDRMEHEVLHVPKPDHIIYLRVPVETSLELLQKKRAAKNQLLGAGVKDTVEEDRTYLEQSHATANWLAERQPNWSIIDCVQGEEMRSIEDIHEEVRTTVESLLSREPAR